MLIPAAARQIDAKNCYRKYHREKRHFLSPLLETIRVKRINNTVFVTSGAGIIYYHRDGKKSQRENTSRDIIVFGDPYPQPHHCTTMWNWNLERCDACILRTKLLTSQKLSRCIPAITDYKKPISILFLGQHFNDFEMRSSD